MLGKTTTEAWVSLLREVFKWNSKGTSSATLPVQISSGFPFTDVPENSNLPNNPSLGSNLTDGLVRVPGRRGLSLPEITVHDMGERMPKKYMDNFINYLYSREVRINPEYVPKISRIKNVFIEQLDGTLIVLQENEQFIFDRERGAIVFELEYYAAPSYGTVVKYVADLYFETENGIAELIENGIVEAGEIFGTIHSLEVDATLQIDLWGGNIKQSQWLLQRFREIWINEKHLRKSLALHGLPYNMNLSWEHSGVKTHLNEKFRPYIYNISCKVKFNTEYKVLNLASDYTAKFKNSDPTTKIYNKLQPEINGVSMRRYSGTLAMEPYNIGFVITGGFPKK